MKILNLLTVTLLLSTISFGQLEVTNDIIETPHLRVKHQSMNKTTSCSVDTVQYVMNKSTSLSSINVNNSTSAYAVGQYFDAPQPLELSGVDFYAYKADATNGTSIGVKVKVYNASPIDSLPMGSALLTTTVGVDTSFGGGALDVLRKSANFSSPLTLTDPFIIVIENNSAIELSAIMNDYQVGDGGQEWLAPVNISGTWLNAYDVNVGGLPFDADMLIEPYISYDLTASFTNDA